MRLHNLKLKNVKAVEEREIEFAEDRVTVISGKNEIGKTTMVQAFDLVMKTKSTSNKAEVKNMKPKLRDADPEISVEFTLGEDRIEVSKVFAGSRGKTTLRYLAGPKAGHSLTGGDAENELDGLVGGSDEALFEALNSFSNDPFAQRPFSASQTLTQALQKASGAVDSSDQSLVAKAKAHRDAYFTAAGRPRGDLSAAKDTLQKADSRVDAAKAAVRVIDGKETRLNQARTNIFRYNELSAMVNRELEEIKKADAEIKSARDELDKASREKNSAELVLTMAKNNLEARNKRISEIKKTEAELGEAQFNLAELTPKISAYRNDLADAEALFKELSEKSGKANDRLEQAQLAVASLEARKKALVDESLLSQVEVQDERLTELDYLLNSGKLNASNSRRVLANIDSFQRELDSARAKLVASSARISVKALTARRELLINGEKVDVEDGFSENVTSDMTLEVPDTWRFELSAPAVSDFRRAEQNASEKLAQALHEAGCESVEEAKEMAHKLSDYERERDMVNQRLALLLNGRSIEDLRKAVKSVDTAAEISENADTLPESLDSALNDLNDARDEQKKAVATREEHLVKLEQLRASFGDEVTEESRLSWEVEKLEKSYEQLLAQLAEDREENDDETLEKAVSEAQAELDKRTASLAEVEQKLVALDAEGHEQRLKELENKAENADKTLASWQTEAIKLSSALSALSADVKQEELDEALTAQQIATEAYERIEVKANAALLLYDTLSRHQAQSQEKYRKPFTDKIDQLGRIIYRDDTFAVRLADDLTVKARVLDGVTIDFDQLSSGAKEQLLILVKLAAAMLVDETDGMPIFLDDQLGHTDPDRQTRMAAILARASEMAQIIVLTADESRYGALTNRHDIRIN